MALADGDTGVACPWIGPGDCDPSKLSINLPASFRIVAGRLVIEMRHAGFPRQNWEELELIFDPYETERLAKLLGEGR